MLVRMLLVTGTALFSSSSMATQSEVTPSQQTSPASPKPWYEKLSLSGYAQLRYNQLGVTNRKLTSDQGDKSIGSINNLFLRRARVVLSGQATDSTYIYIQPDFAVTPSSPSPTHFLQLRDLYADVYLSSDKAWRVRLGQSKVPFGFENLQSSKIRLPLDRDDALNTAAKDERDLGVFLYWATPEIRNRFKMLVDSGLKGSGDYGIFAIGGYNGQTANQPEANRSMHVVSRVTYPFQIFDDQILEASIQAYAGRYVLNKKENVGGLNESPDQRIAASLIYYPQPIGIQVEYTVGKGPEYDLAKNAVELKSLRGGYALVSYKADNFTPYARYQVYRGGRKHDLNAIPYAVDETEIGLEWILDKSVEFTFAYMDSTRTNTKLLTEREHGRLARLQAQWNY